MMKADRVIFGGGAYTFRMQQQCGRNREQRGADGSRDKSGGDGACRGDGGDIAAADRLHEMAV